MRIGQKLSIPLFMLTISNGISCITMNKGLSTYLTDVVLFLAIISILYFVKKEIVNRKFISWLLLLLALAIQYKSHITDLTGTTIFILSLSISAKSKRSYIIYLSMFLIIMLYKFNISNMEPSQMIAYLSGVLFALVIYQHYIHPIKETEYVPDYSNTVIEKIYIDIMELYLNGYSWKQISLELGRGVTGKSLARTLDNEWKRRKFKNREQFAHYLGQTHIINNIDKNLITE